MPTFGVVLDACVLIPASLCDTLLRAAAKDLYRLHWSDDILEEVFRNLVENHLATESDARKRVSVMRQVFPEALVVGHQAIAGRMMNDPKDRHVLAAAVTAGAQVIVTHNLGDFPEHTLSPYDVEAQSPDDFLLTLYDLAPRTMVKVVQNQSAALRNPPMSVDQVLDYLAQHAPMFAERIWGQQG